MTTNVPFSFTSKSVRFMIIIQAIEPFDHIAIKFVFVTSHILFNLNTKFRWTSQSLQFEQIR